MGQVWAARDRGLDRMVALKFLNARLMGLPSAVDRLILEAKAASALNHPGIVTVHEVVRDQDSVAVVMELVDGVSLREFTQAQPVSRVAEWGRQIASALAASHERGIIHLDIKPENLILRRDGYAKILDFSPCNCFERRSCINSSAHRSGRS
jgi:eukaryotic-like serine/threonine-protein kinase